ncbi:MIDNB protein, partial [Eulacestoma nigropectus]|nr:MIDNB protein [Eulacestoma nigropectus]
SRLSSGKLQDLGVVEGSKLTLVPTVEAGLMSQASRPEQSVMQALESLTETQVNDFLSGRSPLTLALRVGDHMMFVQLQLAAQQSTGQLQHRHLIASRGEAGASASPHCRTLHGASGSGFAHIPVVPTCQQSPAPSPAPAAPAPPMYCNAPHAAPVTAGMFRSHGASTQTVNSSVVSSCSEVKPYPEPDPMFPPSQVDCGSRSSSSPGSSPAPSARSRKPGAVIESFVNHAPGVFSGTFSGTLHPNCQDSSGRPRRDIGTILQILNDLLSATRHYQGMPQSLTQLRCQTQVRSSFSPSQGWAGGHWGPAWCCGGHPVFGISEGLCHGGLCDPPRLWVRPPSRDRLRQTENRATRCKVERLQLLLQQKRLRRKARRDARAPYHWVPNRKAGRTNSNSSVSSEGSLDLDFEDSVWKPEVKAEMKSEFVVA